MAVQLTTCVVVVPAPKVSEGAVQVDVVAEVVNGTVTQFEKLVALHLVRT
jgi:hypothetical protein